MFVEYVTEVSAELAEVEARLDRVRADMEEWADVAYRHGEHLSARVGPGGPLAHRVELHIGVAEIHRSGLVYPITWTAAGATVLFPELHADLILTKLGSEHTRLTLRGTYRPPLGVLGRLADRAVLSRVAEATVRNWLDRLAEELSLSPAG